VTGLRNSPRLRKGALVSLRLPDPRPAVIVFQYNPDTLTRTLEPQTAGGADGDRAEAMRIKGPPAETIAVDIELDATDEREAGRGLEGIHPQLAALELLVYPSVGVAVANTALLALGTIEIIPAQAPFTLFVWGPKRVLPVRVASLSITEEAHDPDLNPIRARASLGLRVLSYHDLPVTHPGYHLFLAHQVVKEAMAASATVDNLTALGGDVRLV